MARHWTPEERDRQRELIAQQKPWLTTTGPRTPEGKARVSRNAFKGGGWRQARTLAKELSAVLRRQRTALRDLGMQRVRKG
jgi:hypothetical protein